MQRIKLVDGTFVDNVQEINDYVERQNQDNRKVLNITVVNTDYEAMFNTFSNPSNLTSLEIQTLVDVVVEEDVTEQQWVTQGLQTNYTILSFIKGNIANSTFTIQLHQKSDMEQQLLDTQLAVAELGQLISEVL